MLASPLLCSALAFGSVLAWSRRDSLFATVGQLIDLYVNFLVFSYAAIGSGVVGLSCERQMNVACALVSLWAYRRRTFSVEGAPSARQLFSARGQGEIFLECPSFVI